MARAGITYTEVAKAASRLQMENKNPTVDNVRELIGTGSRSTIMVHLRTWRDKNLIESQADGLPIALVEATKSLWNRMKSETDEMIALQQSQSNEQIAAMEAVLKQIKTEQAIQARENETLKTALTSSQAKIEELTTLLQAEQTEIVRIQEQNLGLERQCAQHQEEISRLHQVTKHTQDNLQHYQDANLKLKEAHSLERDKERHQHFLAIRLLESHLNEIKQNKAMLEHTLNNSDKTLTDAHDMIMQLQNACQTLIDSAAETKITIALLEHQNKALSDENTTQEKQIKESSEQLCTALNQISALTNKQELLEETLRKTEDKAQALTDDKLFLMQEKMDLKRLLDQKSF